MKSGSNGGGSAGGDVHGGCDSDGICCRGSGVDGCLK